MRQTKTVSVVMCTYNGARFLREQMDSVLAQTYPLKEIIVQDDGSTDATMSILNDYAQLDARVKVYRHEGEQHGINANFLSAMRRAEGDYIAICDQDDVWHPDKIRKTLTAMKRAEMGLRPDTPVLVHTDLRVVDGKLEEMDPSFMHFSKIDGNRLAFHQLLVQNVVTGCTMMFNRPLALLTARAEGTEAMMMHDWWMALVASALGKAVFLPDATIDYRQHEKNVVGAKNASSFAYMASRLKGDYIRRMRDESISQAEAFAACYEAELPEAAQEVLQAFISLKKHRKINKIKAMEQYGFWKNTLSRRAGQLWKW